MNDAMLVVGLPAAPAAPAQALPARSARREDVPCTIEMVNTADDFYAHVVLEGCEVEAGDVVLVHGAPTRLAYGNHLVIGTQATVSRASGFGRWWTKLLARFELGLLYEVSFTSARFPSSRGARRAAPVSSRSAP